MVHKLPEPEGEARERGLFMAMHESQLATVVYLLHSLSGSIIQVQNNGHPC